MVTFIKHAEINETGIVSFMKLGKLYIDISPWVAA
jgi:hypothetical protein